jgi:hypothetical protein
MTIRDSRRMLDWDITYKDHTFMYVLVRLADICSCLLTLCKQRTKFQIRTDGEFIPHLGRETQGDRSALIGLKLVTSGQSVGW